MRKSVLSLTLAALFGLAASPVMAQSTMQTIDPNTAIDADLGAPPSSESTPQPELDVATQGEESAGYAGSDYADQAAAPLPATTAPVASATPSGSVDPATTYQEDDLIGAAEGVFGKGAKGLAGLIEDLLKKQGQPNAYIVGREGGGAFVVGLRYGSGTLYHKVEGEKPVYWTGPSIGFDAGANAGSTFVLVYNLYDTEDLYKRFPAGEGQAYFIGGFNASYMRSGDTVLIPIRAGAGLRLGVNAGYMKFSKKQKWLPF